MADHVIDESADLCLQLLIRLKILFLVIRFICVIGIRLGIVLGNERSVVLFIFDIRVDMNADLNVGLLEKPALSVVQNLDFKNFFLAGVL